MGHVNFSLYFFLLRDLLILDVYVGTIRRDLNNLRSTIFILTRT